ncbi:M6 family metalloprotease domain-containing protein [Actinomycetota bacterium Odt1-20B]
MKRISLAAAAAATASALLTALTATTALPAATAFAASAPPSGPCALTGPGGAYQFEGLPTPGNFRKTSGTVRAYTVFIDFPDAPAEGTPQERYAEFFPAVADYYGKSSYGKMDYRSTPRLQWIRMSKPFSAYGIDRGVPFQPGYEAITREIVAAVGDEADLGSYDVLNVLATPNAGPPATEKVLSVTFAGGYMDLGKGSVPWAGSFIWSRQTGDSAWRVLNHENGHAFGLPDLYATQPGYPPHFAGHWDPMDEDWGPTNDFMAWHKWKLGWLDADQVGCQAEDGVREFTLSPLSVSGGVKLVAVPVSANEVITVEARTKGELDAAVCRPGVLISAVSTNVNTGTGPVRVVDATPNSAGCYTDPNVSPDFSDATFTPGQTYTDTRNNVTVHVLGTDEDGNYRVRVAKGGDTG